MTSEEVKPIIKRLYELAADERMSHQHLLASVAMALKHAQWIGDVKRTVMLHSVALTLITDYEKQP